MRLSGTVMIANSMYVLISEIQFHIASLRNCRLQMLSSADGRPAGKAFVILATPNDANDFCMYMKNVSVSSKQLKSILWSRMVFRYVRN
jgi:hypothetical protein